MGDSSLSRSAVEQPKRIQRKRTKGWRMPPGTIYCGRPSRWSNRFVVSPNHPDLAHYADYTKNVDLWNGWPVKDAETAVKAFREMQCTEAFVRTARSALRGKDLACWCGADEPCHVDVLIDVANPTPRVTSPMSGGRDV